MSPAMPQRSSSLIPSGAEAPSDECESTARVNSCTSRSRSLPGSLALPNLCEQARIHASTASACLRKLSDWVNSVSKHHADSRSIMLLAYLQQDFAGSFWFSPVTFTASCILLLTSIDLVPQIVTAVGTSPPVY